MKLFHLFMASALFAAPMAQAQGTKEVPHLGGKRTLANNKVVQAIIDSGIDVVMDDPEECADKSLDGAFITYPKHNPDFLICVKNHDSYAELADTIRHEAHHAIVHCNGGVTFWNWDRNVEMAKVSDIGIVIKYYDSDEHNEELEARNVARIITDDMIARKLRQFCM